MFSGNDLKGVTDLVSAALVDFFWPLGGSTTTSPSSKCVAYLHILLIGSNINFHLELYSWLSDGLQQLLFCGKYVALYICASCVVNVTLIFSCSGHKSHVNVDKQRCVGVSFYSFQDSKHNNVLCK